MPGIVGVITTEYAPDLSNVIRQMVQPLVRQPTHRVTVAGITPYAGMAWIGFGDDRPTAAQDGVIAIIAGEIHDTDGLRERLISSGEADCVNLATTDLILLAFRRLGVASICALNGLYVICIWEEKAKRLTLVNDRYGVRKLYYWKSSDRFYFASEYKAISRHPEFNRSIDEIALSDLISIGFPMSDRTLFQEIKILPGATILTNQDGDIQLRRYWDYQFGPDGPVNPLKIADYVDGMAERTREAVHRRLIDDTCVLLTGGLDSRTIAGFMKQINPAVNVIASTIGSERSKDVRSAKKFASSIGIPHYTIPVPEDYLDRYSELSVWLTEANMSCYGSWIIAQDSLLSTRPYRSVVTGIGGEMISGRSFSFAGFGTDLEQAIQTYAKRNHFDLVKVLLRPKVYQNIRGESLATIRSTLLAAPSDDLLNKIDYMAFQQDFRRHATSIDVLGEQVNVYDPLIDNDLVDYALLIPARLRVGAFIYKQMIARYLPEIRLEGNLPIPHRIFKTPDLLPDHPYQILFEKIEKRIRREIRHLANRSGDIPGGHIQPNLWIRTASQAFVTSISQSAEYLEDYFDMDVVGKIVQDHMDRKKNAYWVLSAILTFAIWRRLFDMDMQPDSGVNQVDISQTPVFNWIQS